MFKTKTDDIHIGNHVILYNHSITFFVNFSLNNLIYILIKYFIIKKTSQVIVL